MYSQISKSFLNLSEINKSKYKNNNKLKGKEEAEKERVWEREGEKSLPKN